MLLLRPALSGTKTVGAITLQAPTVAGVGLMDTSGHTGTGALTLPTTTIAGSGPPLPVAITFDEVSPAQGTSHAVRSRISTLSASGAVVTTYESTSGIILGGSLTYDRTRDVRRSGSVILVDADGSLAPTDADDPFAPGGAVRIERGVSGGSYMSLGDYRIVNFDTAMRGELTLRLEDPTDALRQDIGDTLTIGKRVRAKDALAILWEPVLGDSTAWALDDDSAVLGTSRTYSDGDERLHSGITLMSDMALEVYADRGGAPVLAPLSDPNTLLEADHTFTQAAGRAVVTTLRRSGDLRPFNRQVVVGEPSDGAVVRGVSTITDPTHPYHASRVGLRTAPVYRSAQIATQHQAQEVAKAMLIDRILWTDSVSITAVPDITIEAGDVLRVIEPQTGTDARYRVDRVTLPIVTGSMTITAERIVPLFA